MDWDAVYFPLDEVKAVRKALPPIEESSEPDNELAIRYRDCIRESFHDLCLRNDVRKVAKKKQAKRTVRKKS